MSPLLRHSLRTTALAMVLILGALHAEAFAHVAAHALKHARHTAATHGSVLCTWLCTAGEVSDLDAAPPSAGQTLAGSVEPWLPAHPVSARPVESSTRAPPLLPR